MSIVFLFVAPTIIMYSQGYRFDIKKFQFVETGGIYIKALPEETNIYINDEYINKTSFFTRDILVQNLIPDSYKIRVEKDGYHSWEKNLNVSKRTATEAKYINLFKNDISFNPISENIEEIYPYNNEFLLLTSENELLSYNQEIIESFLSANKTPNNIENISFSPSNEKALIKTTTGLYYLLSIKDKSIALMRSISNEVKNVNFSFDEKGLIYQLNGSVYEIKDNSPKLLSREKVDCFTVYNNSIYTLRNGNIIKINSLTEPEETLYSFNEYNSNNNYEIIFIENELFILENNQNLYHLNNNLFELKIESNYSLKYSSLFNRIIFYDKNNIWLMPLKRCESPFFTDAYEIINITSFEKEIDNIKWINGDYFVFTIGNELHISEIDNRDKLNIFSLNKTNTSNIFFDGKLFILDNNVFLETINKLSI